MRNILVKEDFHIQINQKEVFQIMNCFEDSSIYEEVLEEYKELEPMVLERIKPKAVLAFSAVMEEYAPEILPMGSNVLYTIFTVGKEVSKLSETLFAEDEYLKGMLVDSMADNCLFGMEQELKDWIKGACLERKFGVLHRYEAPGNIPMEVQKIGFEECRADEMLELQMTSGYMLSPIKSICQVFRLTEDTNLFYLEHNCRSCNNLKCINRVIPPVPVTVQIKGKQILIECKEKESLLDTMIQNGIYFSAACGGNGTCGKCKITLLEGKLAITSADEKYFTREDLEKGLRLACQAYPEVPCTILADQNDESDFEILGDYKEESEKENNLVDEDYGFAIDIGTTTIAITLVGLTQKKTLDTFTTINQQRAYGADVISRIKASMDGKKQELRASIQKDLLNGFQTIIKRFGMNKERVKEIVIAGNTTMIHLLMGFDCSGLGVYPFTPVDISLMQRTFVEVFETEYLTNCQVTLLPSISTYVGGDIVSGLYFCGFHQTNEVNFLIDLGTNGEMGIGNRDKIITTSVAAGPAFEGGNITWGMGSIKGAICQVKIDKEQVKVNTIGDKEPIGICGTGVIEGIAELIDAELIDETGLLSEEYFEDGFFLAKSPKGEDIVLTQKDIREVQLAKSAVRAGVETLLMRYGVKYEQVDKVYLAGGFGYKMNQEKAIAIGMLPEELKDKIEAVGNSSLGGAVRYLTDEKVKQAVDQIVSVSTEINLSSDLAFNDLYMEHMFFGEEA